MTEFMHLVGSDDVRAAGSSMQNAANEMQRAAATIDDSLTRFKFFLDDWIIRLQEVLENERKSNDTRS